MAPSWVHASSSGLDDRSVSIGRKSMKKLEAIDAVLICDDRLNALEGMTDCYADTQDIVSKELRISKDG